MVIVHVCNIQVYLPYVCAWIIHNDKSRQRVSLPRALVYVPTFCMSTAICKYRILISVQCLNIKVKLYIAKLNSRAACDYM